jgi:molybdopterin-guanine dinucleotide biosynthesis protein A
LRSSSSDLNLILAVDLPLVTAELLRFLVARARESAAMVTVVRSSEGWQPLCAVYRREFADAAELALRAGRYRIDALFVGRVCLVGEEELQAAGFSAALFRNLNTPEDLASMHP